MVETGLRRLEREYKAHQETGAPFVRDILIISGGGAKGAFGAGFLQGWQTVTGPTALPEFDVVTGVSTGALIAPFAFIGIRCRLHEHRGLLRQSRQELGPQAGRAVPGTRSHVSLFNDDLLQEMIRKSIDESLVQADGGRGGRGSDAADRCHQSRLRDRPHLRPGPGSDRGHHARARSIEFTRSCWRRARSRCLSAGHDRRQLFYADGGATANLTLFVSRSFTREVARDASGRALAEVPHLGLGQPAAAHRARRHQGASGSRSRDRGLGTATHSLQLFAMQLLHELRKRVRGNRRAGHRVSLGGDPRAMLRRKAPRRCSTRSTCWRWRRSGAGWALIRPSGVPKYPQSTRSRIRVVECDMTELAAGVHSSVCAWESGSLLERRRRRRTSLCPVGSRSRSAVTSSRRSTPSLSSPGRRGRSKPARSST